jgi:hypothetical protein
VSPGSGKTVLTDGITSLPAAPGVDPQRVSLRVLNSDKLKVGRPGAANMGAVLVKTCEATGLLIMCCACAGQQPQLPVQQVLA